LVGSQEGTGPFKTFKCTLFRNFEEHISELDLKSNSKIKATVGFKVYKNRSEAYSLDYKHAESVEWTILDSASSLSCHLAALVVWLCL
jgi:hypothetical protein